MIGDDDSVEGTDDTDAGEEENMSAEAGSEAEQSAAAVPAQSVGRAAVTRNHP